MFANVTVIQCTVKYLVIIINVTVDVVNRIPKLVANDYLSFTLLGLLHQINNYDWTAISFQKILCVYKENMTKYKYIMRMKDWKQTYKKEVANTYQSVPELPDT